MDFAEKRDFLKCTTTMPGFLGPYYRVRTPNHARQMLLRLQVDLQSYNPHSRRPFGVPDLPFSATTPYPRPPYPKAAALRHIVLQRHRQNPSTMLLKAAEPGYPQTHILPTRALAPPLLSRNLP